MWERKYPLVLVAASAIAAMIVSVSQFHNTGSQSDVDAMKDSVAVPVVGIGLPGGDILSDDGGSAPKALSLERVYTATTYAIAISGTALYRVSDTSITSSDVSSPTNPVDLDTMSIGGRVLASTVDNILSRLYTVENPGLLRVVDISDPNDLSELGTAIVTNTTGSAPISISADGDIVVLGEKNDEFSVTGIRVLDASDAEGIIELPMYISDHYDVLDLHIDGESVFAALWEYGRFGEFKTFAVTDTSMTALDAIGAMIPSGGVSNIALDGSNAYVSIVDTENLNTQLAIVDVSDLREPTLIGSYQFSNNETTGYNPIISDIVVEGDAVYCIETAFGPDMREDQFEHTLRRLDVSNPSAVSEDVSIELPVDPRQMVLGDAHLYIAAAEDGWLIVSITEP